MRRTATAAGLAAGSLLLTVSAAALAQSDPEHPRTPWGDPDISGVYSEYTTAPLERPEEFGTREFLTQEEHDAREAARAARVGTDTDASEQGTQEDVHYDMDTYGLSADEGFTSPNMRTSVVTMPANGRIPPLVPAALERREARAALRRGREYDGPEYRGLTERCVAYPATMPPILAFGYNSNLQIYQGPGHVLIQGEMGDPRIIPTDGQALPEDPMPQWNGTSVGRWEGDTLVIETTGFRPEVAWRDSTGNIRVTERITRVDHDTLEYAFTVEDPQTWAEPWGGVYPLTQMPDMVLFEVACTEGNYGMANILSGARQDEAEAQDQAQTQTVSAQ